MLVNVCYGTSRNDAGTVMYQAGSVFTLPRVMALCMLACCVCVCCVCQSSVCDCGACNWWHAPSLRVTLLPCHCSQTKQTDKIFTCSKLVEATAAVPTRAKRVFAPRLNTPCLCLVACHTHTKPNCAKAAIVRTTATKHVQSIYCLRYAPACT